VIPLLGEEFRRSIYVLVRRSKPLTFLQTFDAPLMEPNCEARVASAVAPQSLLLMNNGFVIEQSHYFAERVRHEAGPEAEAQAVRAWMLSLTRPPNPEELEDAVTLLEELRTHFRSQLPSPAPLQVAAAVTDAATGTQPPAPRSVSPPSPELAALAVLCQTLFGSNEFLYVD
jgi:hypothetical protein